MIYIIIFLSLLISTFASVQLLKKKNNKQMSMLTAFCFNTLILLVATWILYNINDEARAFGFGHSGLYLLIITIPILTWINFIILQLVKTTGK